MKPYQPPGLWNEVSLGGNVRFRQDTGENLYRKSMYTYWKRSAPAPSMTIFDAPTREKCMVERPRTNTPLQALVTLNDPQFTEAARNLAQRMIKEGGQTAQERVTYGYRLVAARQPKPIVANILGPPTMRWRISRRTRKPPTSSLMWANLSVTKTSTMLSTRLGPLWPACS